MSAMSQKHKRYIAIIGIIIFSLICMGFLTRGFIKENLLFSGIVDPFPKAEKDEILIILGQSPTENDDDALLADIKKEIEKETQNHDIQNVRIETVSLEINARNKEEFLTLGKRNHAHLVLWVEESPDSFDIQFEFLQDPSYFGDTISPNHLQVSKKYDDIHLKQLTLFINSYIAIHSAQYDVGLLLIEKLSSPEFASMSDLPNLAAAWLYLIIDDAANALPI